MRLLVYNIAYGTGPLDAFYERLLTAHRYFRTSQTHIDRLIKFIKKANADIVGLVEVDVGSYRTNYINQAELVASHLDHYHHYSVKYGKNSIGRNIPILNKQGNAILTKEKTPDSNFHYFPRGFKKLVIELDTCGIKLFLVHLALQKSVRRRQLQHLAKLAKSDAPTIIAGDFNTLSGSHELDEFMTELNLVNPNKKNQPTYPAWNPKKQLDYILCSKDIKIKKCKVLKVKHSDHLPLILDFEI